MQFPESWLREFCNPPLTTAQLADTLTMGGLEVEDVRSVAPPFSDVVVGEIREAVQHPNADRLKVCRVDVGQEALLNIVCGAPNARVGIKVPCALVGAELPLGEDGKPFLIKLGKLRGVESQGMLCSAKELHLSQDQGGLLELANDAVLGQNIREHLQLDDSILTLKLTPNLGHCLSVYGVARELAALTGAPLLMPAVAAVAADNENRLPVRIDSPDLCGRFSGRVVRNVDTRAATPAWMVDRLARCGQRSVGALVDISNYVMFERGQPTHIFDLDKIQGGLAVRWAQPGEQLKLLNGNTVALDAAVGVIADATQVESLAGIMGGDATAVSDTTQNIYIEAAFWWPKAIAGRSRRFNFSTDAGHRFERGVDPSKTVEVVERITQLVIDICGGTDTECGPVDDIRTNLPVAEPVALRLARASRVIGMPISLEQAMGAFERLGLPMVEANGVVTVTPPPHRFDLRIEEDLIEEVARLIGYQNLPETPPLAPIVAQPRTEARRSSFAVRRALAAQAYQETINFSFVEERWELELAGNADPVRLLNPIASHMSVMRSSLLGSLLQVLKLNLDRKAARVRVFEIGRVFLRDSSISNSDSTVEGFDQPLRVAGLAYGPSDMLQWGRKEQLVDFFDVKGDVEALFAPVMPIFTPAEHPAMHPGRCAAVVVNGVVEGHIGELHPKWRQSFDLPHAPVLFEVSLDALLQRPVHKFEPISKYQVVERDLAIVVAENVPYENVASAVRGALDSVFLRNTVLFDIYRPNPPKDSGLQAAPASSFVAGEKSLALRITLGRGDANLTDGQIDQAMQCVITALQQQIGARLRA